jgi:hypothetical protein
VSTNKSGEQTNVITLNEASVAQAVFGPLHRHLAHIQEAFRDPNAPRGAPAYSVTLDAQGDAATLRCTASCRFQQWAASRRVDIRSAQPVSINWSSATCN